MFEMSLRSDAPGGLRKSSSFRSAEAPASTLRKTASFRTPDSPAGKSQSFPRYPPGEVSIRQRPPHSDKEFRIVVFGAAGVGKTAIIVRFLTRRFIGDYAHCENLCACTTLLESKPIRLWIQDTVENTSLQSYEEHIQWADGFVIVFSLTSSSSFHWVEPMYHTISKRRICEKHKHVPVVIMGNKSDLCHLRVVNTDEMLELQKRLNCPVVEVSAGDSYNSVVDAFTMLFEQVLKSQGKSNDKKSKKNGTSKIAQLRETLRSLADFRSRTHTF